MELTFPLFGGIIAAILHVISGPDHLAAVTPFAIESKKKAWKVGLFWGVGHLLGMLSIGLLFLVFKDLIPIEIISQHSEKFVGFVLIALGFWVFIKIFKEDKLHKHTHIHVEENPIIHKHSHIHNDLNSIINKHPHIHSTKKSHTHRSSTSKQGVIASLAVGFVHGLAGVAHFLLFLPVIGFVSLIDSSKYIIGFAIGTFLAMISFAVLIGSLASFSKKDNNKTFLKGMRFAGGLFAFVIGIYWVVVI